VPSFPSPVKCKFTLGYRRLVAEDLAFPFHEPYQHAYRQDLFSEGVSVIPKILESRPFRLPDGMFPLGSTLAFFLDLIGVFFASHAFAIQYSF